MPIPLSNAQRRQSKEKGNAMQHVYSVNALIELADIMPGSADCALALGHTAPGDGGGGLFHWVADALEEPNHGTILKCRLSKSGRWRRVTAAPLDIRWFGAASIPDATNAIQSALDTAQSGGTVYVPSGKYRVTRPLQIPQGVLLQGDGLFSELHYEGPPKAGCLQVRGEPHTIALGVSRLNLFVHTEAAYGIDLRGMSYSHFDHMTVHLRQPRTSGFFGPGIRKGTSPYYNVFTACHVAGNGEHHSNGCVGFDFHYDEPDQLQSANANQIFGGRVSSCQIAVRCFGTGNIFHGQVLESNDVGYQFDLCPARREHQQRGTNNDVLGCYSEHVRVVLQQKHADCYVTAQLTMVTGYEKVFDGISTVNCVILSPHNDTNPASRSVMDRRVLVPDGRVLRE